MTIYIRGFSVSTQTSLKQPLKKQRNCVGNEASIQIKASKKALPTQIPLQIANILLMPKYLEYLR